MPLHTLLLNHDLPLSCYTTELLTDSNSTTQTVQEEVRRLKQFSFLAQLDGKINMAISATDSFDKMNTKVSKRANMLETKPLLTGLANRLIQKLNVAP